VVVVVVVVVAAYQNYFTSSNVASIQLLSLFLCVVFSCVGSSYPFLSSSPLSLQTEGTPHFYGNKDWGGREYSLLGGLTPSKFSHRTFIDYDPVTGMSMRNVIRQQVRNVRPTARISLSTMQWV
jgi:hypothetical protein